MDRAEYNKIYNIRVSLGVAAMRIENEDGVDVDDINFQLDELDAMLERFESQANPEAKP